MYTKNIIFPCISWEGSSLTSCQRKKIHVFGGKKTIFPDNTRKIMSQRGAFWKNHLFRKFDENIIFPCISTATYSLAKYLAKLLVPLRESEYIIKSTKDFIGKVKSKEVPNGYQMVSFDVKSLFTNVSLDRTIDTVLRRIYDKHELQTSIRRSEMKELLILCTKNVHFMFENVIKVQNDGMAMGSPFLLLLLFFYSLFYVHASFLFINLQIVLWI